MRRNNNKQKGYQFDPCETCGRQHRGPCTAKACPTCNKFHGTRVCLLTMTCDKCGKTGHDTDNCFGVCTFCSNYSHPDKTFKNHILLDCPNVEPYFDEIDKDESCEHCNGIGHLAKHCFKGKECDSCGETTHTAFFCKRDLECNRCGKKAGHWTQECPSIMCRKCYGIGHTDMDCPAQYKYDLGKALVMVDNLEEEVAKLEKAAK